MKRHNGMGELYKGTTSCSCTQTRTGNRVTIPAFSQLCLAQPMRDFVVQPALVLFYPFEMLVKSIALVWISLVFKESGNVQF